MEIINKNSALLSNFEVYKLLKETKEIQDLKYNKSINQQSIDKHLPTVIYESLKYLEKTACINYSKEIIERFLKESEKFKLTKVEKLQLLNQRPITPVELQMLIENSEERFTIEQMDEVLDFINSLLPGITKEEEQIEGEEEAEEHMNE